MTPTHNIKILMIGDTGAGKTCLRYKHCNGRFQENIEPTIGVDFAIKKKRLTIGSDVKKAETT